MNSDPTTARRGAPRHAGSATHDVIVIGAGIAGIYQLHRLREQGFSAVILEAGSGVGGAWYWNRYPGARLDSESYTYGYFFSEEIQNEWSWSEEFVGQPELERYFNYVVEKLGLREDIVLNARVAAAEFDEADAVWRLTATDGRRFMSRFLIAATGLLSAPQFPNLPGLGDFKGEWYHTALWPAEPVHLAGRKVAVIGTGSSGVQVIAAIGPEVGELTVFQRTPNWVTPLNNAPLTPERQREIRETYRDIHRRCLASPSGFKHAPRPQSAMEVGPEERRAYYEQLWNEPGLTLYTKNFQDILTNKQANDTLTEFLAGKIRARVKDPTVADKLVPRDHGFAVKRPPLETNYFEVFNQDNVKLVDLSEEPIETFTETGLRTSTGAYEFDVIVLATGFDAVTGAIARIDIRGVAGKSLKEHWKDGPRTWLGLMVSGFPNLFILAGPQCPTGNNPRTSEFQVQVVTDCVRYMRQQGLKRIEADPDAEQQWVNHCNATVAGTLLRDGKSWAYGANVPGKTRAFLLYSGGLLDYRRRCSAIVADYRGFLFEGAAKSDSRLVSDEDPLFAPGKASVGS